MAMSAATENLALGAQFKVLAQVFPVLRHEMLGPVSNAALAVAMLRQPFDRIGAVDAQQRHNELLASLDHMLEDSATELRTLGRWFEDTGRMVALGAQLELCRRLLFTQLLRSGKQIALPEPDTLPHVMLPEYAARYVLLAWLLCLLDTLPDGGQLRLDIRQDELRYILPDSLLSTATQPAGPRVSLAECQALAQQHGWQAQRDANGWTLRLPMADDANGASEPTHAWLRNGTAARHARLDQNLALAQPQAGLPEYLAHLQALHGWLQPLEARLWALPWPTALCADERAGKAAWIEHDLAHAGLRPCTARCPDLPMPCAPDAYALGVAYVIEGSQLGGRVLARQLAKRLSEPPGQQAPLRYLHGYGARLNPLWQGFLQHLDTEVRDASARAQALAGACAAFDTLTRWFESRGVLRLA